MTLQRARERIAGLFGEECRDDGSGICAVHSEVLFDGRCEDYPTAYACVLAILDEELADDLGAAGAAMSERVEIRRNPDRSVDEVLFYVGDRCVFHLEQMSAGSWYFGLYAEGEEPEQFGIYRDKRSVVVHPYTDPPRP